MGPLQLKLSIKLSNKINSSLIRNIDEESSNIKDIWC